MDEIKNEKDLAKIIDLCRKKGVESIELQGIKIKLRDEAPPSSYRRKQDLTDRPLQPLIEESTFSDHDVLLWSSAGVPESQEEHH